MAPESRRRKLVRTLLRLIGPLLLAVVILRMPDRGAIARTLLDSTLWPLAIVVLLNFVSCELKVVRWGVFLRTRGIHYSFWRARAAYYASLYIGMLTPGRVGDVLRVQYLRADLGVGYAEGLASVAMDRICDLYVLVGFVLFALVRYGSYLTGLGPTIWSVMAAVVVGPLVLLVPGVADRAAGAIYARFAPEKGASFALFLAAMRANVGRSLFITLPLTVGAFLVNYVQGWLMAHALHLDISIVDATCLLAIANLLGLLPISISGMGVRELLFALILPRLGYPAEAGVSFGLLVFVSMYVVLVAVGFVVWQVAPPPSLDMSEGVR